MIVDDLNIMSIGTLPPEDNASLAVDSYAVETCTIASKPLQPIAWRRA